MSAISADQSKPSVIVAGRLDTSALRRFGGGICSPVGAWRSPWSAAGERCGGVSLGVPVGVATIGVLRPGVLRGVWPPGVRPVKIEERGVPRRLDPGVDRWVARMDFFPTIQGLLVCARSL